MDFPKVTDEEGRVEALARYAVLDTPAEPEFDRITALAARLFRVPTALIVLVSADRQWFKSRYGLGISETMREISFCTHTICSDEGVLVVPDATRDPRFHNNPLVNDDPYIRFYAGAPLRTAEGFAIGSLSLLDYRPRDLDAHQREMLAQLAAVVMDELELRATVGRMRRDVGSDVPAFRETDMRLGFITSQLPAILWTTDRELRFTSGIGAGLKAFDVKPNQLVGVSVQTYFGTNDPEHPILAAHLRALKGEGVSYEQRFEGHVYECRIDPLRDAAGGIVGTIGVSLDISERARADEAARDREERYRMIARATNDVVWDWDVVTGDVTWNDAMWSVFRYDARAAAVAAAATHVSWWQERVHPEDHPRVSARLTEALQPAAAGGGEVWSDEYRFARGDGTYALVYDRGFIRRDAGGRAVRMVGSMLDLTERRQLEARLLQADRLASLGTMAAGVAHEINNPLTYVMTNIGFVAEQLAAAPALPGVELVELRNALAEAQEGAERVRQIVRDLRTYSRGQDEHETDVDVRRVLEWAINITWNEIRHRAQLRRELGPVPAVRGTETRLGQVFVNLLVNAAQAVTDGAAATNLISVTTATDAEGRAVITVSDNGPGVAPEAIDHVFDPFFTTKPLGVGLGLGLFVCHGIVRGLGGTLAVDSPPGGGATFTVTLPPAAALGAASGAARPSEQAAAFSGPARLLVIDDEPQVLRGLQRMMPEHQVVAAESGREALAQLQADRGFDAVLCDVMLGDMTAMDLHAVVAERWPALAGRMIFMTGGAFTEGARSFLERVPNPCIEKPFDVGELRAAVARARAAHD